MDKLKLHIAKVIDFRINRHKLYPIDEILFLCISSCICGTYNFEEIEDFGNARIEWLKKYYPYTNGIPSHDTINRVLSNLEPNVFNNVFMAWVKDVLGEKEPDIISIDGKALCGTAPTIKDSKKLTHQISAWASETGMVLGQTTVMGKGHEIEGITELLNLLDIEDDIVTIDAIGCQTAIIEQIVGKNGHYVIAVKSNQKSLEEEIENAFNQITIKDINTQTDATGGRINTRTCRVIHNLETYVPEAHRFAKAKTIIQIQSERFNKKTQKTEKDTRLYISDLDLNANYFNQIIRSHWGIENGLHWHLDVIFNEDKDRKRTKNLASNFGLIRKIALNILKPFKLKTKISMPRIQKKAMMSESYLESILF